MNIDLSILLKQQDILLNNVDLNPIDTQGEFLVTTRSKNAYLIKLTDPPQVATCYDSIDEVRYGKFSQCGQYVYTLTKTGTLNVFNKSTAKLISKLRKNMMVDGANENDEPEDNIEIDGMLGGLTHQTYNVNGSI